MTGDFEFSVDAYHSGWGEGNVSYGGLGFQVLNMGSVTQVWPVGKSETLQSPDPLEVQRAFNRLTVQVKPGRIRCLCNGHLVYEDADPSPAAPWLALLADRFSSTRWRNLSLTGDVRIPREVPLSHGDRLEAWVANSGNRPPRLTLGRRQMSNRGEVEIAALDPNLDAYFWRSRDGVISSRKLDEATVPAAYDSLLSYYRPLRSGEAVRYEFFYEPGKSEVHPVLDRMAFVLRPEGVSLHWVTDSTAAVNPWNGLADDNLAEEPQFRSGPPKLPFKPGDWNSARLSLVENVAVLELNGVEILRRPLEPTNDRHFGFYHRAGKATMQVRKVVLSGNWPEALSKDQMSNLLARPDEKPNLTTRRARHAILDEGYLVKNWESVTRRARALPPAERYRALRDWVTPGPDHPHTRFQGGFTPVGLAPPVEGGRGALPAVGRRANTGGVLTCSRSRSALRRRRTGKARRARPPAQEIKTDNDSDERGKLAFLALVGAGAGQRRGRCGVLAEACRALAAKMPISTPEGPRWTVLVAAARTAASPRLRPLSLEILDTMVKQWEQNGISADWERSLRNVRERARYPSLPEAAGIPFGTDPLLKQWARVTQATADSRGNGLPLPHWLSSTGAVRHFSGHNHDYLYFNTPLRGNFEITCQLNPSGNRNLQLSYAGTWVGLRPNLSRFELSHFGRAEADGQIDPPLANVGEWYDYRLVVKDGVYTAFANGKQIHEERLPDNPDPWLAIHASPESSGGCRNLKISGSPTIPDRLGFSDHPDLAGWLTYFPGESIIGDKAVWRKQGEEITGRKIDGIAGSGRQSVLRYQRPLLEDGEIEYEFRYAPGQVDVPPALDRLTFLLDPQGVRIHWLTDAQYDRTGLAPDNAADEPAHRRGPKTLPLKENEWNQVSLVLKGDVVTLSLNGVEIYRYRPLEATNQRTFGLFHYADESEVRVRNITYRGDWPRALPSLADQELAAAPEK